MIFLASTSSKIQLITSAAGQINVHASYVDLAGGTVAAAAANSASIVTATTTDIVAAPAASTVRNIKTLKIGNNHATVSNTVTLQHTDGTNVVILEQLTLAPLERLGYEEGVGIRVFDALGREKLPGLGLPTGNANTADVVANAADTYLAGSSLLVGGRIQAGSFFKWRMRATKTGAGVAAPIFNVRVGTAGAIGDAVRATVTAAAQTAVIDTAVFEMDAVFRQVGATAILSMMLRFDHLLATTGFATSQFQMLYNLGSSFDVSALTNVIGVSVNPGSLGVWTFQQVSVEANNILS